MHASLNFIQFPLIAPPGIVYPPVHKLNVTVMVSISSGLIISNTFQASQGYAFFHLRNETDANFTLTVNSNHSDTDSSTPETIQLTSIYVPNNHIK